MSVILHFLGDRSETRPRPPTIQDWEGPVPRVGEFVHDNGWWQVLTVAYSSMSRTECWVDVSVRPVDGDPREVPR